jgi:hypothetical protein
MRKHNWIQTGILLLLPILLALTVAGCNELDSIPSPCPLIAFIMKISLVLLVSINITVEIRRPKEDSKDSMDCRQ